MIRPATHADANPFHFLARRYIEESGQGRAYSERQTQMAFDAMVDDPTCLFLLAESPDGIVAASIVQLDHAFTVEPIALLSWFYIMPDYRGTGLARAMLQGSVSWADTAGASHTFASGNAMLSDAETKMFENLTRKFNFRPAGTPVLVRPRNKE